MRVLKELKKYCSLGVFVVENENISQTSSL